MEFPSPGEIARLATSAYERDFVLGEYGPGLPYHLKRLDQLLFSGDHVLDAGAGVGQWTIALAQRFRQVSALDLKDDRLAILSQVAARMRLGNIDIRNASIDQLPYADQTFDAIFCYGVIMFTRVPQVLAEFFRVLRPGGRVYICLNGDGWSQYLIHQRGRENPQVIPVGRMTLYKTAWHRAKRCGFLDRLGRCLPPLPAQMILQSSEAGRLLEADVRNNCGPELHARLLKDVKAAAQGQDVMAAFDAERAYLPGELQELAETQGFTDFQWASEAGLLCEWLTPPAASKYEGYFNGSLAVWECLLTRPAPVRSFETAVRRHLTAARHSVANPVYVEPSSKPVVSNGNRLTFPLFLLKNSQALAARHGGVRYLKELSQHLTAAARTDEDRFRRIMWFVQKALYRDPVAQPVLPDGSLPDAATILFAGRGRCGHVARLLAELCRHAGLEANEHQLSKHVIASVKVADRWIIADADAFKHGVVPVNRAGRLLSLDDLRDDPYQIDRFPTTGWYYRPGSRYTTGVLEYQVAGYVDALEPEDRGFIAGYFVAQAKGYPPSLPRNLRITVRGDTFELEWQPSEVKEDRLVGYRVCVGLCSRGWSYDDFGEGDAPAQPLPHDVLRVETTRTRVEGLIPSGASRLCASVSAVTSRIEKEPETHFWPSEEIIHEL